MEAWQDGVTRISRQFREALGYLLRVLDAKLRAGGNPQLEDLLIRLNYSGFYDSDTVSMLGVGL